MYCVNNKEFKCPITVTLDIFNDRWKLSIIWHLLENSKRFKDLHKDIDNITQKTLTVKLKDLESKNIINRKVYAQVPPKVVYSLTNIGKELEPLLKKMHEWGTLYTTEFGSIENK